MQALLAVLIGAVLLKMFLDYRQGEKYMAKLDTLNAALDNIDVATTELATQLTALVDRVDDDDVTNEEIAAAVAKASDLANRISGAATAVAGIEPTPVAVPDPVEEIPVDEEPAPVEGDGETTSGGVPIVDGVAQPGLGQ